MTRAKSYIEGFDFEPGTTVAGKYEIESQIGAGWEGEVYVIRELGTDIRRAAKFFFPQRNQNGKCSMRYARKLHKLRDCPVLIKYHTREQIAFNGIPVDFLVSDYVEGERLSLFLKRQRGGRIPLFQGLHLLHALAVSLESMHAKGEYHGDLHPENVIIKRYGLGFELRLLDFYHWGPATREHIQDDICDAVKIFYDAAGGKRTYQKHPAEIKAIICGLKKSLILRRFPTAVKLREHLESLSWNGTIQ